MRSKYNLDFDTDGKEESLLANLSFKFPLRKYQTEILELVDEKLKNGEREIHIVAPPGAGKTIIGLQLIANYKQPSLILTPNTTIQSQWGQKLDLFVPDDEMVGYQNLIGTHEDKPLKPITVMTYQVLSTPGKEQEYLTKLAHKGWVDELVKGRGLSIGEAELRIIEILQNNPKAHQKEISRHVSRLRKKLSEVMDLNDVLHANAMQLLQALRRQKFKLVLFDECHHLTDYWAAIMKHLIAYLDAPLVIGLTGTPPEKKSQSQEGRYISLVGDIDYQVPTQALVKEGGLAPFQDLAYFVEPTAAEFKFLEEQHNEFHRLLDTLVGLEFQGQRTGEPAQFDQEKKDSSLSLPPLTAHIIESTAQIEKEYGFNKFIKDNPALAAAYLRALWKFKQPGPRKIELSDEFLQAPVLDDWMLLIDDFAAHKLKLASDSTSHALLEEIKLALRKLGYGITEQGLRKQASPVDRVLAFSEAKGRAVCEILALEYRVLEDKLRACVVTDFEKMSATSVKNLEGVLSEESGGAIAVMRTLLKSPISLYVNPCLVTGSLLLVDNRVAEQFAEAARQYLKENGHKFEIRLVERSGGFSSIEASSGAWESRLYVALATSLFERGITKCLIGTRGLFGEGWDSQGLNTLLDLTTTTSPVSVKQLRGRSIRIQNNGPFGKRKVANNWDVVCIAPSLEKGLNDYQRFVRKHEGFFGICDDGQIECGVGHVHPSFSELTAHEVFASYDVFNDEMMERALVRDAIYDHWKVGEPYQNRLIPCLEVSKMRKLALTPPHLKHNQKYKEHASAMRAALNGVYIEHFTLASVISLALLFLSGGTLLLGLIPPVVAAYLSKKKADSLRGRFFQEVCRLEVAPERALPKKENPDSPLKQEAIPDRQTQGLRDMARAVLSALELTRHLPPGIADSSLKVSVRKDGSYRIFLDDVEPRFSKIFNQSMKELLSPISNQPYLIPKYEYPTFTSEMEAQTFFKRYLRGKAEARAAGYHAVPKLLARSQNGRDAFQDCWNKYVSPGFIVATETKPELLNKYFGIGPSLAQRLLWE
ncbi:MAG: DEAD/DEAH box helicase family protein [Candidatus Obscuribacterales bacterium]|nr:DEAD/DEAH box helicase family protein [Candidatus Obscuribacterales bacterium]